MKATSKTTTTSKTYDCIQEKRRAQMRIHDEVRDLTPAEQIEWFRRNAEQGPLGDWWRRVKERGVV